jgi:predicted O-methyltransferase YrrM
MGGFEAYLAARLGPSDQLLDRVLEAGAAAGLPPISISANQGRLLAVLVAVSGAQRLLELGTLGGYSAIWMARALPPGGRLITVDADESHLAVARSSIAMAGLEGIVELRLAPAAVELARLEAEGAAPFDLVFIDVDEPTNAGLFPAARRLVRPGGIIVVGAVDLVRGTRRLAKVLAQEPDLTVTAIQAVGSAGLIGFVLVLVGVTPQR